jgi:hypothetical protein
LFNANRMSVNTVWVNESTVTQTNGTILTGTESTPNGLVNDIVSNSTFILNHLNAASVLNLFGGCDVLLGSNSSVTLNLGVRTDGGNDITVQSTKAPTGVDTGKYTGNVVITGFDSGQPNTLDLQGFAFTSFDHLAPYITTTPTGDTIRLPGGGSIAIGTTTALSASDFAFSPSHGPVT